MSPLAVGVDLCSVERMANALQRTPGVLERICTPSERTLVDGFAPDERPLVAAQLFAAKEAVMKLLGRGFAEVPFDSVEILPGRGVDSGAGEAHWPGSARVALGPPASGHAAGLGIDGVDLDFTLLEEGGEPTVLVTALCATETW